MASEDKTVPFQPRVLLYSINQIPLKYYNAQNHTESQKLKCKYWLRQLYKAASVFFWQDIIYQTYIKS
jgi:hypothetical protein